MKRFVYVTLIVLFAVILGACAKATSQTADLISPPIGEMINPGDKIGDFLITTGEGEDITYVWNLHSECVKQGGVENYSCKVNTDTKMNVSWGVYASIDTDLDTMWSEHTYKMFINDRPVNLDAFGSIDVQHPIIGKMRHWNVVIVAAAPGEIIVRTEAVVDGEPSADTKTFIFSVP